MPNYLLWCSAKGNTIRRWEGEADTMAEAIDQAERDNQGFRVINGHSEPVSHG